MAVPPCPRQPTKENPLKSESMELLSAVMRSPKDFPLELSERPVVYVYIFNISSDPSAQNGGLLKLSGGLFDRTIFSPSISVLPDQ